MNSDSCLDAETLAAWMDGGLSGAELRMAHTHVADCARCQALVGAMARTSAAIPATEPTPASRRWLAWAVPLTAAATALVIWTTVPRNAAPPATPPALAPAPAVANVPQVEAPQAKVAQAEASLERKAEAPPARTAAAGPAEARRDIAQNTIAADAPAAPAQQARKDIAAAPANAPPATLAAPAAARAQSTNVLAERVATDIRTPNPMIRWRIAGSSMERSTDGGATWTPVPTGIATPLAAAAAPAADVCWAVGRLGVVLLTTDARTWRGISFPVITDLSAVIATNARTATVTTTDGRSFTTTDGGMTWKGN